MQTERCTQLHLVSLIMRLKKIGHGFCNIYVILSRFPGARPLCLIEEKNYLQLWTLYFKELSMCFASINWMQILRRSEEFIRFFWKAASVKSMEAFNEAIECMRAIDVDLSVGNYYNAMN